MTIIKILDSKNLTQESDPFKVHIILGEKIRALEEDNKALDNNLEDLKEQCSQKEKAVEDLKYDLNHERVINEELEEDLDRKIDEVDQIKKDLRMKEESFDNLEMVLKEKIVEIFHLRENTESMGHQIFEAIKLEKKVDIQNNLINDLKNKLKEKEEVETFNEKEEVEKLVTEIKHLEIENGEKKRALENVTTENEMLKAKMENLQRQNSENQLEESINLEDELSLHVGKGFKCEKCGKEFETRWNLQSHLKNDHEVLNNLFIEN